jgi:hypothetical protein
MENGTIETEALPDLVDRREWQARSNPFEQILHPPHLSAKDVGTAESLDDGLRGGGHFGPLLGSPPVYVE